MPEFIQQYDTETQCEAALVQARRPKGFCCTMSVRCQVLNLDPFSIRLTIE